MAKLPRDTINHFEGDGKGNINLTITKLVRCKDCKWWKRQDMLQGRCVLLRIYPTGEWYCGNAKLRGDSDE